MSTGLLHAHSGLRYLILLLGVLALVRALAGIPGRRTPGRSMAILATSFAGLLHLQVLLGLALVLLGRWRTAVLVHLGCMVAAAIVAQLAPSIMRRRAPEERTHLPYALSAGLGLLLIWLGIRALGVGLFQSGIV